MYFPFPHCRKTKQLQLVQFAPERPFALRTLFQRFMEPFDMACLRKQKAPGDKQWKIKTTLQ